MAIKVLSYNIHKGIGGRDRRYRIDRIIEVIERESPDIICLQEVDRHVKRSRYDNQPELLSHYFQMTEKLYQFNVTVKTGGYGNLFLSRWPLLSSHQISLTLHQHKPRGAQWGHVITPYGELRVVNWHLGLAERERHWQARRLLEHHLFRRDAHLPTLIIGDTNDWRNTLADGPFAIHGFRLATTPPARFRTFPAYWPLGALDKAFINQTIRVIEAKVIKHRLAQAASDHLPILVTLELPESAPGSLSHS